MCGSEFPNTLYCSDESAAGATRFRGRTFSFMRSFDANDAPQRRITGTLFVTESLFAAAFIASVTLLAINATQLTGTDAMAGIPGTIQLLGRAAIAVPVGWLMDRAGRRVGLVLGYALGTVGFALNGLAVQQTSFLILCTGALLAGMANGTSQQSRFVASEVWPADRRARVIGFIVFAGTVGAIFGPLLVAPPLTGRCRGGCRPMPVPISWAPGSPPWHACWPSSSCAPTPSS